MEGKRDYFLGDICELVDMFVDICTGRMFAVVRFLLYGIDYPQWQFCY